MAETKGLWKKKWKTQVPRNRKGAETFGTGVNGAGKETSLFSIPPTAPHPQPSLYSSLALAPGFQGPQAGKGFGQHLAPSPLPFGLTTPYASSLQPTDIPHLSNKLDFSSVGTGLLTPRREVPAAPGDNSYCLLPRYCAKSNQAPGHERSFKVTSEQLTSGGGPDLGKQVVQTSQFADEKNLDVTCPRSLGRKTGNALTSICLPPVLMS